jgi:predicted ester cyclase
VGASGAHYGKPELTEYFKHVGVPFKDVKQEPVGEYLVGDTVIIETVMKAVHVGTYMGIPPSNKQVVIPTLNVFEVKYDKIVTWRQYQNFKILADQHNR